MGDDLDDLLKKAEELYQSKVDKVSRKKKASTRLDSRFMNKLTSMPKDPLIHRGRQRSANAIGTALINAFNSDIDVEKVSGKSYSDNAKQFVATSIGKAVLSGIEESKALSYGQVLQLVGLIHTNWTEAVNVVRGDYKITQKYVVPVSLYKQKKLDAISRITSYVLETKWKP